MEIALIGNGGHAKEIMAQMGVEIIRFVQDSDYVPEKNVLPLSKFNPEKYKILIAIGDSEIRKKVCNLLPKETKYFTFIHPTSQIFDKKNKIGDGSFIGPNCILTTNISIGNHSSLLRSVNIGHDVKIDNFFSAMPNTVISGNVTIGECCYFGNNSSVKEKIILKDSIKIGMNAAVVKNINEPGTYVGVPVKKLIK